MMPWERGNYEPCQGLAECYLKWCEVTIDAISIAGCYLNRDKLFCLSQCEGLGTLGRYAFGVKIGYFEVDLLL